MRAFFALAWDVILLQAGDGDTANKMNEIGRKYLVDYVDSVIETPHTFWWHSTWFNSADPDLYPNRPYPGHKKIPPVCRRDL